jgi:hypothetical protein
MLKEYINSTVCTLQESLFTLLKFCEHSKFCLRCFDCNVLCFDPSLARHLTVHNICTLDLRGWGEQRMRRLCPREVWEPISDRAGRAHRWRSQCVCVRRTKRLNDGVSYLTADHDRVDVLGAKTLDSYQFTNYWLCFKSCCLVVVLFRLNISYS